MIANNLKVVLATTFTFYLKAHKFHWNVMGPDFAEHHGYLGGLWEETFGAVDIIAETIRTQGELSPGSYAEFEELSVVSSSEGDVTSPGEWIQTSYNTHGGEHTLGGTPLRKNYAGIGFTYDPTRDAFIPPQPYQSWILNEETCLWDPPVPYPADGDFYTWDEETLSWIEVVKPTE